LKNVAKNVLNLLEQRLLCKPSNPFFLSISATVGTGFTDLFDQINRLGIPVFV